MNMNDEEYEHDDFEEESNYYFTSPNVTNNHLNNDDNDNDRSQLNVNQTLDSIHTTTTNNTNTILDALNLSTSCCGDDTMHLLMDAELRLNASPPTSNTNNNTIDGNNSNRVTGNSNIIDGYSSSLHLLQRIQNFEMMDGGNIDGKHGMNMANGTVEDTTNNNNNNDNAANAVNVNTINIGGDQQQLQSQQQVEEDEEDGMSSAAESLLRGPIMAAKSVHRLLNQQQYHHHNQNNHNQLKAAVDTPSTVRERNHRMDNANNTPSTMRERNNTSMDDVAGGGVGRDCYNHYNDEAVCGDYHDHVDPRTHLPPTTLTPQVETPSSMSMSLSLLQKEFVVTTQKRSNRPPQQQQSPSTGHLLINQHGVRVQHEQSSPHLGHIQSNNNQNQISPSTARNNFVTSPQDSVSTIGSTNMSPSELYGAPRGHRVGVGVGVSAGGLGGVGVTVGVGGVGGVGGVDPPGVTTPTAVIAATARGDAMNGTRTGTATSYENHPEVNTNANANTTTPSTLRKLVISPQGSNSQYTTNSYGHDGHGGMMMPPNNNSLEHMIALGEEQMRIAAIEAEQAGVIVGGVPNDNGGSSTVPVSMSNTNCSINNGKNTMPRSSSRSNNHSSTAVVPSKKEKKPFLKRGTRKEPSALHKMMTNATTTTTTPSTQQRTNDTANDVVQQDAADDDGFNNNYAAATTPSNTTTAAAQQQKQQQPAMESLSDRKSRLERLEKMQEDLMKDLQRREARKEEARKDRRLMKQQQQMQMGAHQSKKNVVQRGGSGSGSKTPSNTAARDMTPSQARSRSVPRQQQQRGGRNVSNDNTSAIRRVVNGAGVVEMTPSQIRDGLKTKMKKKMPRDLTPSQARRDSSSSSSGVGMDEQTPSQARVRSVVKQNKTLPKSHDVMVANDNIGEDVMLSQALGSSPTVDFVNDYDFQAEERYDVDGLEDVYVEGEGLMQFNDEDVDVGELVEEHTPKPPTKKQQPRSNSTTRRPRTSSRPRASSAAKQSRNGTTPSASRRSPPPRQGTNRTSKAKSSKNKNNADNNDNDKLAFEEWKRKEEEQWALIKNMRRRQETALREAEGERERAKAYTASEKESVQKWAAEQRALIKKERHKAANAALLASKKANQERREESGNDFVDEEEHEALKAELERVKLGMKKMKLQASEETKRMKEHIRRQERTISALRSGKDATTPAAKNDKNPANINSSGEPRRALGDCTSKQNTQQQGQRPKSVQRRKSTEAPVLDVSNNNQDEAGVQQEQPVVEDVAAVDTSALTEDDDPTDQQHWLQQRLSKLNDANNRLGAKMTAEANEQQQPQLQQQQSAEAQRKPYNAADYGATSENVNYPTQALTGPNHHADVPQVVTAVSPAPAATSTAQLNSYHQRQQRQAPPTASKSQVFTYKNGTQKEVLPDGTTTISFANGDRKRTYANEKKGIVVYYYAATKVRCTATDF